LHLLSKETFFEKNGPSQSIFFISLRAKGHLKKRAHDSIFQVEVWTNRIKALCQQDHNNYNPVQAIISQDNHLFKIELREVMGPGQNFLTWIRSGQYFIAWVGSAIFGLGFGKFPLKISNFSIFFFCVKKYLGQRRVGLLFTVGQKYDWVGSRPIFNWGWKDDFLQSG